MTSWQRKKLITTYELMAIDLKPYLIWRLSKRDHHLLVAVRQLLSKAKETIVFGQ